ncbi:hypothetical protein DSO57_1000115 [Entomophthora muscae]|uniref:Uncharacterized protein n=1 Tax=Entomophthora muscae TaxID=34485 RepID=A0ACC2SMQ0_9FUNG|nr:hypothetical protein DSO57_1000115 [Entomophthora muscae]
MFTLVLLGAVFCYSVEISHPKVRWSPCEYSMDLSNAILWTGSPLNFKNYHLAEKRETETITSYNGFFKEHVFTKEKETYWFGPNERVSDIKECDIRYRCPLRTSSTLIKSLSTTSTYQYTFDEWKEITRPNPPHRKALTDLAAMSVKNYLNVTEKAPRYIWFNPIFWGVKGTYTVKYKFGFSLYSVSEEIEVYFPMKVPSGQISGLYGLGKAYKMLGKWHLTQ